MNPVLSCPWCHRLYVQIKFFFDTKEIFKGERCRDVCDFAQGWKESYSSVVEAVASVGSRFPLLMMDGTV